MSRKRGKKPKAAVEAIPDDILAEGSGPVRSATAAQADAIATVEDVVTTADIATTDDVVTADDVVATAVEPATAGGDTSSKRGPIRAAEEPLQEAEDVASSTTSTELDALGIASAHGLDLSGAGNGDGDRGDDDRGDDDRRDDDRRDDDDDDRGDDDRGDDDCEDDDRSAAAERGGDGDHRDDRDHGDTFAAYNAREGDVGSNGHGHGDGDDGNGDGNGSGDGNGEGSDDGDGGDGDDDAAIVFPTSAASMDAVQLKHLVEALVFASDRPLTVQRLRQLTRVSEVRRLEQALTELSDDYRERGLVLQQVSGGYQFRTRTQFSPWVQQLIAGRPVRLSRAQLETLAIIAYRQPITRPEIDDIRGVDSSATLKLLIDRMLIRVLGKREEVGRPILYGTTKEFLDFFSLGDLRELPTLREYSELTAESRKVMSDRLGIEPDGGDGTGLGMHGNGAARPHSPNGTSHGPSKGSSDAVSNGASDTTTNGASGTANGMSNDHDIEAATDDVEAATDDIEAATDDIEAVFGETDPALDNVEVVTGDSDSESTTGDIEAASADVEAAFGDVEAASADVEAAAVAAAADVGDARSETETGTSHVPDPDAE
ncbi:MAG TPA: SMC-Scp complex subunit ScpB [Kofleriaceae bacterium]|nr:SMC-Scp complex subunit ScpB [Kofleriaceae bacterium]